jgi:hypothetical protein
MSFMMIHFIKAEEEELNTKESINEILINSGCDDNNLKSYVFLGSIIAFSFFTGGMFSDYMWLKIGTF